MRRDRLTPLRYAKERYIYAFNVSIVLFTLGGLYAVYEGYQKILHPHELTSPIVAIVVLLLSNGLEGWALRTAAREANRSRGSETWLQYIRRAKAPEIPVILLEDTAAVTGLLIALGSVSLSWPPITACPTASPHWPSAPCSLPSPSCSPWKPSPYWSAKPRSRPT